MNAPGTLEKRNSMSTEKEPTNQAVTHRIMPLVAVALVNATLSTSAQEIAEGDSPLYSIAVHESIEGLKGRARDEPAAPAKVCPKCGKVHPAGADASETNAVSTAGQPSAKLTAPVCPQCGKVHARIPPGRSSSTAAGTSPKTSGVADGRSGAYYYCKKCKTYHLRKPRLPGGFAGPKDGRSGN
jgi:ribosomal protein L32